MDSQRRLHEKYLNQTVDALRLDVAGNVLGTGIVGVVKWEPGDEVLVDTTVRSRPLQSDVLRVQDRLDLGDGSGS